MQYCRTEAGAVLVTTIVMITTLTLLVLSLMQTVLLYLKSSNQFVLKQDEFYGLEAATLALDLTKIKTPCLLDEQQPNHTIKRLLRNKGCNLTSNGQNYQYLLEDLGDYPCLRIVNSQTITGSHHWRLSVASAKRAILQIRVITSEDTANCALIEEKIIREGIASWRYLAKYTE